MSITSTFPYTNTIVTTVGNYPVPLFPGAYIIRSTTVPTNGMVPIYQSISDFSIASSNNGLNDLLQDKDGLVIVLPGFTLNLYVDWNYFNTVYSYDNSVGTDVKYFISAPANLATSCRLFYKFPSGNVEVGPFILNTIADSNSVATYNGVTYRLFEFRTGGAKTFYIANCTTNNTSPLPIQALLIGGGGGGGNYYNTAKASAGGGAGAFITTSFTAMPGDIFTVTVGAGGAGAAANSNDSGTAGSPTSITRTVSGVVDASLNAGGGGSGASINDTVGKIGTIYGSTGGGSGTSARNANLAINGAYTLTSGSTLFTNITVSAFRGGTGQTSGGGGGGGGAGAVGGNGIASNNGGDGGAGKAWFINGTIYAGGGAGMNATGYTAPGGLGGSGGGGNSYVSAVAHTGSGGGAGWAGSVGGSGGSGICIFAIPFDLVA